MTAPFEEIFGFVQSLEICDSHEHLPHREGAQDRTADEVKEYLQGNFSLDLLSAGLSRADCRTADNVRRPLVLPRHFSDIEQVAGEAGPRRPFGLPA